MNNDTYKMNRRTFVKVVGTTVGAVALGAGLPKFVEPALGASVPVPLDSGNLAKYVNPMPIPEVLRGTNLRISMTQFSQDLGLRDKVTGLKIGSDTTVWGYNGSYPGPTIETRTGRKISVKYINNLPTTHLLPIDHTLHGAMGNPDVRNVVHLHGGHTPPESDGFPEAWFTPGNSVVFKYPNSQQATTLWYHDHALGITRLNITAGLSGVYLIRDEIEDKLKLPRGRFEIPLIIQDRSFNTDGSLFYPPRGQLLPNGQPDPQVPPVWQPEFFGDTILVNGMVWPFLNVEPKNYRFRILNNSGSRFYRLKLSSGQSFFQIGTDGGLLPEPVPINQLLLAPAERADVILNFSDFKGQVITLTNDAPTPFPDGGDPNDPNINPNTAQVMQFRVGKFHAEDGDSRSLPKTLRPIKRIPEASAVKIRDLTLNENLSAADNPIESLLGTTVPLHWSDPITEAPKLGTTEIWRLTNLTGDAHPIHLHLVQFQILDRQALLLDPVTGDPTPVPDPSAPRVPPAPNEAGWKDTVRVDMGTVTRIIARFDMPGKYVWHCHILEHEDNDMMRPYQIVP
jgi:spore coat protein A, manganese oxidase